jgi:L-amino acid N-acyltransferase YncA
LDAEVVAYFKAEAQGRGYQTLINEALKDSIRMEGIESLLRRVIREELNPT